MTTEMIRLVRLLHISPLYFFANIDTVLTCTQTRANCNCLNNIRVVYTVCRRAEWVRGWPC